MKNISVAVLAIVGVLVMSVSMLAHHGSGISYDLTKPWSTKATIVDFKYINPHQKGNEIITNAGDRGGQ